VLRETWLAVIEKLGAKNLVIGGKSMGGRIASMVADAAGIAGMVCLGYPFHPVGKPERLRVEHLRDLKTPALIVQGERDPFGTRSDAAAYELSEAVQIHWLPDGDHNFEPRKAAGRTEQQNWNAGVGAVVKFTGRCADDGCPSAPAFGHFRDLSHADARCRNSPGPFPTAGSATDRSGNAALRRPARARLRAVALRRSRGRGEPALASYSGRQRGVRARGRLLHGPALPR